MPLSSDDNGAYLKSRITIKPYYYGKDQINTVHQTNDEYYYNKRKTYKSYSKVTVLADNVVPLHRTYGKAKSFPLTRTIIKMSNPINGPPSPYVAVLYQAEQIIESSKNLPHGNAIEHDNRGVFFSNSQSNELRDT